LYSALHENTANALPNVRCVTRAFRFAIWIDSPIHFKRIYSFCKKSAFRFTCCPAVFLAYLLQSSHLQHNYSVLNITIT